MCEDWRTKLIGSSVDSAGNVTRHNAEFSTLLRNESKCKDSFYRLYCLAYQLDVVFKKSTTMLDGTQEFFHETFD